MEVEVQPEVLLLTLTVYGKPPVSEDAVKLVAVLFAVKAVPLAVEPLYQLKLYPAVAPLTLAETDPFPVPVQFVEGTDEVVMVG